MSDVKVLDRIRKLLNLAENSSSEAEAANAAGRAAALMEQHEISAAQLRLVVPAPAEPIEEGTKIHGDRSKRRVAWKGTVAFAVAARFDCRAYWEAGAVRLFGRLTSVQAASYTAAYLWAEVERLADATWDRMCDQADDRPMTSVKRWKNSFRLGAAARLSTRLHLETVATQEAFEAAVEAAKRDDPDAGPLTSETLAMVLVDRDRDEVASAYGAYATKHKFRDARSIGRIRAQTAYDAGKKAADDINIDASRRPRLNRGTEVLP